MKLIRNGVLSLFLLLLAMTSTVIRAEQLKKDNFESALAKQQQAVQLMDRREYAQALSKFMYLLNEGHRYGERFQDIKRSFLIIQLKTLAGKYPQTQEEIKKHILFLKNKLVEQGFDRLSMDHLSFLAESFALDELLANDFVETITGLRDDELSRKEWGFVCLGALKREKKEDLIVAHVDLPFLAERQVEQIEKELALIKVDFSSIQMMGKMVKTNLDYFLSLFDKYDKKSQSQRIKAINHKLEILLREAERVKN